MRALTLSPCSQPHPRCKWSNLSLVGKWKSRYSYWSSHCIHTQPSSLPAILSWIVHHPKISTRKCGETNKRLMRGKKDRNLADACEICDKIRKVSTGWLSLSLRLAWFSRRKCAVSLPRLMGSGSNGFGSVIMKQDSWVISGKGALPLPQGKPDPCEGQPSRFTWSRPLTSLQQSILEASLYYPPWSQFCWVFPLPRATRALDFPMSEWGLKFSVPLWALVRQRVEWIPRSQQDPQRQAST